MNLFRLAGDMTHLLSVVMLLLKIHATRSCRGISLRTQELYGLVFLTRYIDIFFRFVSLYNTVMKLVFLASSATIIYYMRFHRVVRTTYDRELDTFRSWLLIVPCFLLALVINQGFAAVEVRAYATTSKSWLVHLFVLFAPSLLVFADPVGILPLLRGSSNPTTAGPATTDAKH
ncbi:ER lumen protein-retaining receptor B, variant 2 [Trebouxia sp. C0009 RCD-2024]